MIEKERIHEVGYFDIGTGNSVEESVDGCKKGNNFGRLEQEAGVCRTARAHQYIFIRLGKRDPMNCNRPCMYLSFSARKGWFQHCKSFHKERFLEPLLLERLMIRECPYITNKT